jgi:hypothetical protein
VLVLEIDNRNGAIWEPSLVDVTLKTSRVGKAGILEFTILKGGIYEDVTFQFNSGDVVRVRLNEKPVFYGYIFTINNGREESVKITAYDQLRYLMSSDTYVFKNTSASEIIQKIAIDTGLKVGNLTDTVYKIPTMIEDGTRLLEIVNNALTKTVIVTGRTFVFHDDFGKLSLTDIADWKLDLSLGDVSLAYDYKLFRSIDNDTYNRVKIVQDNKESGKRDVYIAQDSSNIAKWGRLQLYQKADDKMNPAQINETLNNLISLKNRETRTFSLDAIGDIRIRAGCSVSINIAEIGINQFFLVEECNHKFEGADHTMSLELKVYA